MTNDFNELMYIATYLLIKEHFDTDDVLTVKQFKDLQNIVVEKAVKSLKELKKTK